MYCVIHRVDHEFLGYLSWTSFSKSIILKNFPLHFILPSGKSMKVYDFTHFYLWVDLDIPAATSYSGLDAKQSEIFIFWFLSKFGMKSMRNSMLVSNLKTVLIYIDPEWFMPKNRRVNVKLRIWRLTHPSLCLGLFGNG